MEGSTDVNNWYDRPRPSVIQIPNSTEIQIPGQSGWNSNTCILENNPSIRKGSTGVNNWYDRPRPSVIQIPNSTEIQIPGQSGWNSGTDILESNPSIHSPHPASSGETGYPWTTRPSDGRVSHIPSLFVPSFNSAQNALTNTISPSNWSSAPVRLKQASFDPVFLDTYRPRSRSSNQFSGGPGVASEDVCKGMTFESTQQKSNFGNGAHSGEESFTRHHNPEYSSFRPRTASDSTFLSRSCVNSSTFRDDFGVMNFGSDLDSGLTLLNDEVGNLPLRPDDLKLRKVMKKSQQTFVPESLKDKKYWINRKKNNIAAQISREKRRMKSNQVASRVKILERINMELNEIYDQLKIENTTLKTAIKVNNKTE